MAKDAEPDVDVSDPVCGRQVARDHAVGPVRFRGRQWFFCSWDCRTAFKRQPDVVADSRPDAGVPLPGTQGLPRQRSPGPFRVIRGQPIAPAGSGADGGGGDEGGGPG